MAKGYCDVCNRAASVRLKIQKNGRPSSFELCNEHYREYQLGSGSLPFSHLRTDSIFDRFFNTMGSPVANQSIGLRDRDSVDIDDYLSEEAKELMQKAAQKALELGTKVIDTEHFLYCLIDTTVVENILKRFKLSALDLKQHIEFNVFERDKKEEISSSEVEISPRVKSALYSAFSISRDMGHSYIGPEHLFIALMEIGEGSAHEILKTYGLSPEALRQKTVKVVGKGPKHEGKEQSETPNLDKYSRDLTKLALDGRLDPVIGRSKEISTTIEILARRTKNNPVLIGEPGVGKTAIIEGLAQRIANEEVPEVLRDKRLVELSINSVVAGAKYKGEFEERIKQVIDEIVKNKDEIIVFIDEVHTIMGAGAQEGGLDVANTIKPVMARGELHLIGATTLNEYQKHIEKDAALERRFQPVYVDEPSVEQTVNILQGIRDKYEAHHKVKILDEAIKAAAEFSDRYIANRFLPDKAIDLMDQAAARVRIAVTSRPDEVHELEAELKRIKREYDAAKARKDYDKAKELTEIIETKEEEMKAQTDSWKKETGTESPEVNSSHIAEIVSSLTGIPVNDLTEEERDKLLNLESKLHERVIGQNEAIVAVSRAIRLAHSGLRANNKPIANFLFLGPTGVGKTELAKSLAQTIFSDEDAVIRIDMSEYMERHSVSRLIGAPPGYVGYDEGGQLTERVRRRPYSVVLLDEIEKAHSDVHNILLQVFDDGRLTDGKGRVVDFTNTVIIATSNIGSKIIQDNLEADTEDKLSYEDLQKELKSEIKLHFRPEFINRLDEIIVFHALSKKEIRSIVELNLENVRTNAEKQGLELSFDSSLVEYLAEIAYQPEFGARELKRQIRSLVEAQLAERILDQKYNQGDKIKISFNKKDKKIKFKVRKTLEMANN